MTHAEALGFWFGRINYEQKSPQPSDLSLDRIRVLLELLGRPQERYRIVHVAGSKGKGSTSAMLASVLRQAGYRVGLFTSPHLVEVGERIQVDGVPIGPEELTQVMEDIATACAQVKPSRYLPPGLYPLAQTLTFFEIATALGYLHFARRRVNLAVVEVGLGGRFDSTNVCQPLLSIITSISFDHTRQLGNTLALIAREKAGIIKKGRPTVSGARAPEARSVIEQVCAERASPLFQADRDFVYRYAPARFEAGEDRPGVMEVKTWKRNWPPLRLGLVGEHQAANAALVVAAVEVLREQGMPLPDAAMADGLAQVQWPARLERLAEKPLVLLDCAHNVASVEALVQALETSYPLPPTGKRLLLFAGSRDKDLPGMLQVLVPRFDQTFLTSFSSNPRRVLPEELRDMLALPLQKKVELLADSRDAWRLARSKAGPEDLLCITGSVFLAGELRPIILADQMQDSVR